MSDTPKIPDGQPTWCRVRSHGSCMLPKNPKTGGVITSTVPVRLDFMGEQTVRTADGRRRVQVWMLPAEAWSEGDHVEVGPLPPNVVVRYDIARPIASLRREDAA